MAKILVIEDERLVAGTLQVLLRKAGHQVVIAANGKLGVESFEKDRPDLIITDIIMPEMEGIEAVKAIRASAADVPIIAISGGGRTKNFDFLRMAIKLGATTTLRKPFENEALIAAVDRCLSRSGGSAQEV